MRSNKWITHLLITNSSVYRAIIFYGVLQIYCEHYLGCLCKRNFPHAMIKLISLFTVLYVYIYIGEEYAESFAYYLLYISKCNYEAHANNLAHRDGNELFVTFITLYYTLRTETQHVVCLSEMTLVRSLF